MSTNLCVGFSVFFFFWINLLASTCVKLTIKILEPWQWRHSVFFIFNFEHNLTLALVLLFLTLSRYVIAGEGKSIWNWSPRFFAKNEVLLKNIWRLFYCRASTKIINVMINYRYILTWNMLGIIQYRQWLFWINVITS